MWTKLRAEYREAGMEESVIAAMYEFDCEVFRNRYCSDMEYHCRIRTGSVSTRKRNFCKFRGRIWQKRILICCCMNSVILTRQILQGKFSDFCNPVIITF